MNGHGLMMKELIITRILILQYFTQEKKNGKFFFGQLLSLYENIHSAALVLQY